ncbi:hydroxycarboxylic acid receptor 2-like [Osmerus mordax]|uniref:hydroxycarboxylic acid receptor 2-like n=1 Tax=Osmerus mordax TaxID=8014 RepID=UPI003510882B
MNSTNDTFVATVTVLTKASTSLNLILGLPTNGYVLWLIASRVGGIKASEIFSFSLAVNEILFCLFSLLLFLEEQLRNLLNIFSVLSVLIGMGRPLFQTCICLERYLAVVHPLVFLRYKPLRYRIPCSALVCMVQTVYGLAFFFIEHQILFNIYLTQYIFLVSLNLFCCFSVLWALKRSKPGDGERKGGRDVKMRAFKIILLILVTMMLAYFPWIAVFIAFQGNWKGDFFRARSLCFSVNVMTGFVQPLIYLHGTGRLPCIRGF